MEHFVDDKHDKKTKGYGTYGGSEEGQESSSSSSSNAYGNEEDEEEVVQKGKNDHYGAYGASDDEEEEDEEAKKKKKADELKKAAEKKAAADAEKAKKSMPDPNFVDWNLMFQELMEAEERALSEKEREMEGGGLPLAKSRALYQLTARFTAVACAIGSTIIAESALPANKKTVKPADVGGIAGGEKFFSHGVFFKRVHDDQNLYGGDEKAMKVAGHELKGYRAFLSCGVADPSLKLSVPLMTIVDSRGYRLVCSCVLPLYKTSLQYGSADAGKSAFCNPRIVPVMDRAGEILNLKKHKVAATNVELVGPCDIEVHIGKDDRFYVLDTARVFPPQGISSSRNAVLIPPEGSITYLELPTKEWQVKAAAALNKTPPELMVRAAGIVKRAPIIQRGSLVYLKNEDGEGWGHGEANPRASALFGPKISGPVLWVCMPKGQHLYELMRPALVKASPVPLSSDAFTFFGQQDYQIHNKEASSAVAAMLSQVIPKLGADLVARRILVCDAAHLRDVMHERGINMRYLAILRSHCVAGKIYNQFNHAPHQRIRSLIMTDMVNRLIKNAVRAQLRAVNGDHSQAQSILVDYMNRLFGKSEESTMFWRVDVYAGLMCKFGQVVDETDHLQFKNSRLDEKFIANLDPRLFVNLNSLFYLIQRSTGVQLTVAIQRKFEDPAFVPDAKPFTLTDLLGLAISDKRLAWSAHSMALELQKYVNDKSGLQAGSVDAATLYGDLIKRTFASPKDGPGSAFASFGGQSRAQAVAGAEFMMAAALQTQGKIQDALAVCEKALHTLRSESTSIVVLIGGLFLRGRIQAEVGRLSTDPKEKKRIINLAVKTFDEALLCTKRMFGSAMENFMVNLTTSLQQHRGHPVYPVIQEYLRRAEKELGETNNSHWTEDTQAATHYFPPLNIEARKRLFRLDDVDTVIILKDEEIKQHHDNFISMSENKDAGNEEETRVRDEASIEAVRPFFFPWELDGGFSIPPEMKSSDLSGSGGVGGGAGGAADGGEVAGSAKYFEDICKDFSAMMQGAPCAHCNVGTATDGCEHGYPGDISRFPLGSYRDLKFTSKQDSGNMEGRATISDMRMILKEFSTQEGTVTYATSSVETVWMMRNAVREQKEWAEREKANGLEKCIKVIQDVPIHCCKRESVSTWPTGMSERTEWYALSKKGEVLPIPPVAWEDVRSYISAGLVNKMPDEGNVDLGNLCLDMEVPWCGDNYLVKGTRAVKCFGVETRGQKDNSRVTHIFCLSIPMKGVTMNSRAPHSTGGIYVSISETVDLGCIKPDQLARLVAKTADADAIYREDKKALRDSRPADPNKPAAEKYTGEDLLQEPDADVFEKFMLLGIPEEKMELAKAYTNGIVQSKKAYANIGWGPDKTKPIMENFRTMYAMVLAMKE